MKTIELSSASKSLAEYANELGDELVVLTSNDKPVAALVSLKNVDPESLSLSTSSEFREIIAGARREVAAGDTISLDSMKCQLSIPSDAPRK
jgi:PHD/YefM family antitoxin component YafN of YafNO toxin-antitoxin module